jgi:CHAT domain-containing protein
MFIACSDAASAKEDVKVERLLSVGDPAFDRKRFPLPYLEPARREAETVATYYYRPITLIGEKATKKRLLEEIGRFDVLHFALHGVVDERSPMRSKLLLAKTEREGVEPDQTAGFLEAHEIYRLPLSRPRLVVLAACRSGIERYYRGEGMMGISRAFIAKGVPLVVASLWDVDASATAELMIKFHGYRKLERLPSSAALRQAQLTLLRDLHSVYRSPYYWASFESIGGHSGF